MTQQTNTESASKLKEIKRVKPFVKEVKLSFFVRRIHDIDLVKQRFRVSFHFTASWVEEVCNINPPQGNQNGMKQAGREWMKDYFAWDPQLQFTNLEETEQEPEKWYRLMRLGVDGIPTTQTITLEEFVTMDKGEKVYVMQCENHHCWFHEKFELQKYPFDHQLLQIGLTSTWDTENVILSFDHHRGTRVAATALPLQSYILHRPRLLAYNNKIHEGSSSLPLLSNRDDSVTGAEYNRVYLALSVARKPNSILLNVMFIIFLLGTASLFTFTADGIGDRQSTILTLLLTTVAFKYVTVSILPDIPYVTYMDWYTLLCVVLQFHIFIVISVIDDSSNDGEWYRTWQFKSSTGFWVAVNVILGGTIVKTLVERGRELKRWNEYYDLNENIERLHRDGREGTAGEVSATNFFNEESLEVVLGKPKKEKHKWIAQALKFRTVHPDTMA